MAQNPLKRSTTANRNVSPPATKRKLTTTTTNRAVADFFKPSSEKEPRNVSFRTVDDTLLVARHGDISKQLAHERPVRIAAFDFDDTLITTKSGLKFARTHDDWRWWHPAVPGRLKELQKDGYIVVIITNQGAVKLAPDPKSKAPKAEMKSLQTFKGKVTAVLDQLEMPISLYAATGRDLFRKPRTRTWDQIREDYRLGDDLDVDHENSVFVGDAAGRVEDKTENLKKDHSCSDRDFAHNVGIPFKTPQEFFLGSGMKPFARTFDPATYLNLQSDLSNTIDARPTKFQKKNDVELVLFCGSPGSGKSTYYWTHMESLGYERVNQDILKTRDRCVKVASHHIQERGKSVVVDNTNADAETRAIWIALARSLGVSVQLIHFTASTKLCEHNDTVRALAGDIMNPEGRAMLPKLAFTGFASRYKEPKLQEGFESISKVDFCFEGSADQKRLWSRYWIS